MVPKTKIEKRIVELQKTLPSISKEHHTWAKEKCMDNHILSSRKSLFCLECGHSWKNPLQQWQSSLLKTDECPKCKVTGLIKTTAELHHTYRTYYTVLDTIKEFQVIRMIVINKYVKKLKPAEHYSYEVIQHWIDPKGNRKTFTLNRQSMSIYYDAWIYSSDLTLKNINNWIYRLRPYDIYPKKKVKSIIKRNGFKTSFHGMPPVELFQRLLTDTKAETLFKRKQYLLLQHEHIVDKFWNQIKICLRNNYIITKPTLWSDLLSSLIYLGKDINNPKYICPADIHKAHDHYLKKEQERKKKIDLQERIDSINKSNRKYQKDKKQFFDLCFIDNNLKIFTVPNVLHFYQISNTLKHCVFDRAYYDKKNSLILSAEINNEIIETIEVDLKKLSIRQAAGFRNTSSIHHDRITKLVNDNLYQIKQKLKPIKIAS